MSRVKICGLSRMEDIEAVNLALPEYIGFVFAESRRRVQPGTAAGLKERLDKRIAAVGVFVNQEPDFIAALCRDGVIDMVQLHGEEDSDYVQRLRSICSSRIIKSVGVAGTLPRLPEDPDYLLFDTASEQRGGVGKAFDWRILKGMQSAPYFLAGGLDASNVAKAIAELHPFCVDVSSGVETDGVKDAEKIDEFVKLVRGTR